ncbi:DUF1028 domain-containing protein [Myxococcota bacterium]|nr:DUF1028 domain-containing protein [Myxococcota bacterium]
MLVLLLSPPALATWSIVAADAASGQVGGAVTSCVGSLDTAVVYGGVPGVGAVHAQAQLSTAGRDEAVRLLAKGASPDEVIAAITAESFDAWASSRQYGVVDLQGRSAAWTGEDNGAWAGDQQGQVEGVTWSAQGNILTGAEVIDQAVAAFQADACDLPERLMQGIEAGAEGGAGDSRCTGGGIGSDSASITVQAADGSDVVRLSVVDTAPDQAVAVLRQEFDAWRVEHPCPEVEPPADTGSDDTGAAGDEEENGCGCAAAGSGAGLVLALVAGWAARRRRAGGAR